MQTSIKIENLCKKYQEFELNNVSFSLPMGSIMGFIGENGAGKTTTIKSILNLIHKNDGSITIFEKDHIKHEKEIKQDIGIVLDECMFPENLNAKQIPLILKNIYHNWDNHLYGQYITRFKLPMNKAVKEFSKGMKMKLAIACALAHKPKLLILDEATSGLDPVVRSEILDVFLEFIQDEQHSILLSSHITSDLEKIADYITFIHEGKIVFSTDKDTILYEYGMLKCTTADLQHIDNNDIITYHKNDFSCEALIKDKARFQSKYPSLVVDSVNLEDIMLMLVKGNKVTQSLFD